MLDSCQSPVPPRECDSMLLTMPSARLPCSAILSRLPVIISIVSSNSARVSSLDPGQHGLSDLLQLVQQLDREAGEVVDEVQRVLDLVGDAGGELAERGHLLGLDQVGLGRLQPLQRVAQLGEQPHVLDGDHGLGGEGFEQFDLLRREGAGLGLRRRMQPMAMPSRSSGAARAARTPDRAASSCDVGSIHRDRALLCREYERCAHQ